MTCILHESSRQQTLRLRQDEFNFRVDKVVENIDRRLHNYEQVLIGAVGLFAASENVQRRDFAAYVGALQTGSKYPGIQGIGFARMIPPQEKSRHVASIRAEGFPDYAIHPEGERELYTSIIYLEPFDWRNQRAFGFDMYSEPVRRLAMSRARDEGKTIISGKVRLRQETEQDTQPGFLMYLPVYQPGSSPQTTDERRAKLLGWVYAPFRMNDLAVGILGQYFGEIGAALDLEIYDGATTDANRRLYDSREASHNAPSAFRSTRGIPLLGQQWTVSVRSLPAFDAGLKSEGAYLVLVAGSLASVLLALVFWLLLTGRRRALLMAEEMTEELRRSEANKNALFENMSSGVAVFEVVGEGLGFVFSAYNRAAEIMDQRTRVEVLGKRVEEIFPAIADFGLLDVFRRVWQSGTAEAFPAAFYRDERIAGWRETYVYKLPDGSVVALYNDVSARRKAEQEQERLNRALRLLSDCTAALVHAEDERKLLSEICRLIVERGGYVMAWVGYAEQDEARSVRPVALSGYENGYLDGIEISWGDNERGQGPTGTAIRNGGTEINQDVLSNPRMLRWRAAAIARGYRSSIALPLVGETGVLGALTMYARDADAFNEEEVRLLEEMANDLAYGIVTLRARVEHAAAKEKVAFLAHFDSLTHLPNRLLLRDRFEQATLLVNSENSGENSSVALLYLDLDNFKQVNDALGLEAGDRMLVMVVERLRHCVPATGTISRLSGDEFVILLAGVRDLSVVVSVADAVRDAFAEPIDIDGSSLNASFSIGISLFPGDGKDFDTLLNGANTALIRAKESGRNTYRFFTHEMNVDTLERIRLTGGLLKGLRQREFVVFYQPQIDIVSRRMLSAEALLRWRHPVEGLVSPAKFIPLAEQSGHIVEIGEWVLNESCRQAKLWLDAGQPLVVAVNLSAVQFKRSNVLEVVNAALERSGLPAGYLELELTESILLQDVDMTMKTLRSLKELGVKLSIDDFGTGYSSLSYLKQLAVDKLKIDQSFVRDMLSDADGASIVKAIIQLGHSLQLTVIAEGVETRGQLDFLAGINCDEVQGYLFSRPVPADEFALLPLPRG